MDVSNFPKNAAVHEELGEELSEHHQQGAPLLETLVSLTGMPEELMHQELGDILHQAGSDASTVTLDQLRHAMILYLEQLEREAQMAEELSGEDEPLI
jgi:hypothetical protein